MGVLHVGDKLYKRVGRKIQVLEIIAYNKNVRPVELYLKSENGVRKIYPVTEIGKTLFLSMLEVPYRSNSKAQKEGEGTSGLWSDNLRPRYPVPESEKYEKMPSVSHFKPPKAEPTLKSKGRSIHKADNWSKWNYKIPEKKK